MKITLSEFSGRYLVDGIAGKSFSTRSAAEKAYAKLLSKQQEATERKSQRMNPPITVSFVLGVNERNRLCEIAESKGLTLSKLIRRIVEKEVQHYGEEEQRLSD